MAGKLRFDVELGTVPRTAARKSDEDPLGILVLADLSARDAGGRADAASLTSRRIAHVDVDNFEQVLARTAPAMRIEPVAGQVVDLRFESLEDFHPDALYRKVDAFANLRDLRQRLRDPARFAQAVSELMTTAAAQDTLETPSAETSGDLTARLLGGAQPHQGGAARGRRIDELIRRMVEPHVVHDPTADAGPYLAALDATAGELMRGVLADPAFSSLEARWRAVHWLVTSIELGESLSLSLLDVSRSELIADLVEGAVALDECALFRRLVERLESTPPGVIVLDIPLTPAAQDLRLLARLGAIGAQIGAPVLAAASAEFVGIASFAAQPDPRDWPGLTGEAAADWQALRDSPVAQWIALAAPRIVLRQPYGADSDEIDAFAFEELAGVRNLHERLLWGNPAYGCALLLAQSFTARGWSMEPGDDLDLEDLPTIMRHTDGESSLQPCAEIALGERGIETLLGIGLMPFVSHRNRNACRLARFQSIAAPASALAWPGAR